MATRTQSYATLLPLLEQELVCLDTNLALYEENSVVCEKNVRKLRNCSTTVGRLRKSRKKKSIKRLASVPVGLAK